MHHTIRYIELFAGVGGFRYGIEQVNAWVAAQHSTSNKTNHFTCVYANEFDKYANSVYRKHFGVCDVRDVREVTSQEIPEHDLLVAGFPCQAFSICGNRRGFDDTRGTLFFEIARIVTAKQPRFLLLENVKGLLSHHQGKTFATILSTLDELGYDVRWQVCNSKDFGVAQNRERVYLVGHLRGKPRPKIFPFQRQTSTVLTNLGGVLSRNQWRRYLQTRQRPKFSQGTSVYGAWSISPTLTSDERMLVLIPPKVSKANPNGNWRSLSHEDVTQSIRNLTPLERERLQGFTDYWTKYGVDGKQISDTQRFKMLGNAVTTTVVTAICKRLAIVRF